MQIGLEKLCESIKILLFYVFSGTKNLFKYHGNGYFLIIGIIVRI